jgi:hypothetical protein
MTMDDFITMRDKILQSNNICTSSYLGMVVYLGMVLDDRLILQGVRGPSPPVPWQVRWTCSAWVSRGASGWVLGRLMEGQQEESSLIWNELNLPQHLPAYCQL